MQEKPNYLKALGGAALIGGVFGILGEALLMVYAATPLYGQGLSTLFVLGTLGVIGSCLFIAGIYPKFEKFGGMGAVLPFAGLCAAFAGMTFGVGKATGSAAKGALKVFIELFLKVVILGMIICCIVGLIVYFTGFGTVFTAPYAPAGVVVNQVGPPNGTAAGPPMGVPTGIDGLAFLWAFITAAVISMIAQIILMLTKLKLPTYLVIIFVVGAILTPFGVMKAIVVFGGAGLQVLTIGAGEAVVSTFNALLGGNPLPFIEVLCLFVFLYIVGVGGGLIKYAATKGKGEVAGAGAGGNEVAGANADAGTGGDAGAGEITAAHEGEREAAQP
ncbi:MAG: SpoVA/SpoVAEb family sporulation membrane protein [Coriobacteriia bacterium]|nr:SpoVA/SpoVAEb family sporulation membrane protein [Coriobacteriia bacterium]